MGILIDNPSKGKKGCLYGVLFIGAGILLYDSIGAFLILIGVVLLVIGRIKHWFYNK